MQDFWQLPAATTFVRNIAEDLRAGNNVVAVFPEHYPTGWLPALRAKLRELGLCRLQDITVDNTPPVVATLRDLDLGTCSPTASPAHLCNQQLFHSRLLHIQPSNPAHWQNWRQFIVQYEDACSSLNLACRTLFVTTLSGQSSLQLPSPSNLLRIHHWQDRLDSFNLRLFTAGLLADSPLTTWQRHLAVALLAELALWDPEVCILGASKSLTELLEPENWLTQLAIARDWSPNTNPQSPQAHCAGIRQNFEGHPRTHSAWLALANQPHILAKRIWAAQLAALFPLLEHQRQHLLNTHAAILRVPWKTAQFTINHLDDLEFIHIGDQLHNQHSRGLRESADFAYWLRDIRNLLAHSTPISAQLLLQPRFANRLLQSQIIEE